MHKDPIPFPQGITRKLLIYFVTRDFLLLPVILGLISKQPVQQYLSSVFKGLLPFILFYLLPVAAINALLFGWVYAYLVKRSRRENSNSPYIWYAVCLLALETVLLKVTISMDIHLLILLFVFLYLLVFTWVYFRTYLTTGKEHA